MKNFPIALLALALGLSGPSAKGDDPGGPTRRIVVDSVLLSTLAEEARTNSPALRAAQTRVRAARANAGSIRTWDDPMVMLGGVTAEEEMRAEDGDIVYGLEQRLPLWGRPKAMREAAGAESNREEAEASYRFQMLRLEIARQAFRTALADRTVAISREDAAWLDTMTRTAEERYRSGEGGPVEVLRLQNEQAKRREQLRTDERQLVQEQAALNRLLGRPLESAWPPFDLPAVGPAVEFTDRLRRLTLTNEARLKAMRQEVRQAKAMARVTEKMRLPDVSLSAQGRQYSGTGEFREGMFALKVNLPWINRDKYRRDIERDREKARAAEEELADYELFVPTEARRVVTLADAARRQAVLYRDQILPRSELAVQSAHAAWISQRGMFLDVMEARRMLLEARMEQARSITEQYSMLIELTLCCGAADLESLEMLGAPDATPAKSPASPAAKP